MKVKLTELRSEGNVRADLGDLTDLQASIKEVGVLEPLVIRKNGKGYILLAGHRRLAAAKLAGLTEVPAHLIEVKDGDDRSIQLAENLHRKDLAPLEVAEALGKELVKRGFRLDGEQVIPAGLDEVAAEIAIKTGASKTYVKAMARLAFLPDFYKKLMANDNLTVPQALRILQLPREAQLALPKKFYRLSMLTTKGDVVVTSDLESFIERLFGKDLKKAPFDMDDPVNSIPCSTCEFNTSNVPELFAGTKPEPGICRKAACYRSKCQSVAVELKLEFMAKNKDKKFLGYVGEQGGHSGAVNEVKGHAVVKNGNAFYVQRGGEGWKPKVFQVNVRTNKDGEQVKPKKGADERQRDAFPDVVRKVQSAMREKLVLIPASEAAKKVKLSVGQIASFAIGSNLELGHFKRVGAGKAKGTSWDVAGISMEQLGHAVLYSAVLDQDTDAEALTKFSQEKALAIVEAKLKPVAAEVRKAAVVGQYGYAEVKEEGVKALVAFIEGKPLVMPALKAAMPEADESDEDELEG